MRETREKEIHMRRYLWMVALVLVQLSVTASAEERSLGDYLSGFDYAERVRMKIQSKDLVNLLREGKAQLVDIRFREENQAWRMGFGLHIPINELPKRMNELDKSKIIVTACPHKDRAVMAMAFLKLQGFEAKYLEDGLVSLAEYLRGDKAREFAR